MEINKRERIEEFAKELSEKVRYFANVNQYPDESDEQKAYLEGVQTAIAMMYIDLTGTPKEEKELNLKLTYTLEDFAVQTIIDRYQSELDQPIS